jgi:hypothetical protein
VKPVKLEHPSSSRGRPRSGSPVRIARRRPWGEAYRDLLVLVIARFACPVQGCLVNFRGSLLDPGPVCPFHGLALLHMETP